MTLVLPTRKHLLYLAAGFFFLTLAIYAQVLDAEFVRWDDDLLVFENPVVWAITPSTIWKIFTMYDPELYIPLTFLSYQINYLIGGTETYIYHFTNLILHTLNALFVMGCVYYLTKGQRFIALIAGLLFAVHPLHTEAVMWISARKDVLSTLFFLASLFFYLRYRDDERRKWYIVSLIFFLCALLSKIMVVTLPVILILIIWFQKGRLDKKSLTETVPYFVLGIIFGIVAILGKTGQVGATAPLEMILMASKSLTFYIQKLIIPTNLSVIYPFDTEIALSNPDILISMGVMIAFLALSIIALRKSNRIPLFCFLFYVLTAVPTYINYRKGFEAKDIYFASDRYVYIPSIGIIILIAYALYVLRERFREQMTMLAAVIVIFFGYLSFNQAKVWQNSIALFTNALELYPTAQAAHNNLGTVYHRSGELQKAEEHYREAIAIRPLASTYSNLGSVYRRQNRLIEAVQIFQRALEIDNNEKDAHFGLGILYAQAGDAEKAEAEYHTTLELDPTFANAYLNLGALAMQQGKTEEAIVEYEKALEINPFYANANFNIAVAFTKADRVDDAIVAYEQAIRFAPALLPAYLNLGILHRSQGRHEEAREQFEAVLKIDPGNEAALRGLGEM